VRDGLRRPRAALWVAVAVGLVVGLSPTLILPSLAHAGASGSAGSATAARASGTVLAADIPATARSYPAARHDVSKNLARAAGGGAVAAAALEQLGQTVLSAAQDAGVYLPAAAGGAAATAVPVAKLTGASHGPPVQPLRTLRQADLLVVAPKSLPTGAITAVRKMPGVTAAALLDAARIEVNGGYVATLGVDPSTFREFAARPTALSNMLWQNVADGAIAVSYLMGKQEKLPLDGTVTVTGTHAERLPVGGFGTVGISGVDAVVSDSVARSLGMPAGNAIVISAPDTTLSVLMRRLKLVLPSDASVAPLVAQAATRGLPVTAGSAGAVGVTAADGPGLSVSQTKAFLTAALSRVGMPYVWGGDGPSVFDCSGLVQWSMRQAGIVMPRVAADQAQAGPRIPLSDLEPGDLLFYHTDPTAPDYISHVAIYLGDGLMEQAPEPGMDVQVVPAIFGPGFAGAIRVYPRVAAAVAADLAG
jgi:peptidoglycan DL-endopeptidase CwlO